MLYIRPCTSEDHYPEFEKAYQEGKLAYLAFSGREKIGHILYRKQGDSLLIEEVECGEDESLFDGLLRTVCDAAVQSGMDQVKLSPDLNAEIIKSLQIPVDAEGVLRNLPAFLHNCKSCRFC